MKTHKPVWKTLTALTLTVLLAAGIYACCDDREAPMPPGKCSNYGTFTAMYCGVSMYGGYYIKLSDNHFLQPCASDITLGQPITEGQKIRFGYEVIKGYYPACDDQIHCMAIDDRLINARVERVRITCLQVVNDKKKN